MSPKKNKKGKSGKKGKGKVRSEKAVLTKQQLKLEEELREKTELCLSLTKEMEEARSLYEKEVGEKEDLFKHLKRILEEETQKAAKLQHQMDEETKAFEPSRHEMQEKVNVATQKFQVMKDSLAKEKLTISGKLSLLKDVVMQREDLIQKLSAAEEIIMEQTEAHEEKLREAEIGYTMLREQLEKEYLKQVDKTCAALQKKACEMLTDDIKRGLEKSLEAAEHLNSMSDEGFEAHETNIHLKSKKMLLDFKLEMDNVSDRYVTAKIKEYKITAQKLQDSYEKQQTDENSLETEFCKFKEMSKRLQELNLEFLKASDEFQELKMQSTEQKRYLPKIQSAVRRRQKNNAKLVSTIKEAEEVFRSAITKPCEKGRLGPKIRPDLLQQFVTLTDISYVLKESKDKYLFKQSRKEAYKLSAFNKKRRKDKCVQTTDILAKYGRNREFKCHFFEENRT